MLMVARDAYFVSYKLHEHIIATSTCEIPFYELTKS